MELGSNVGAVWDLDYDRTVSGAATTEQPPIDVDQSGALATRIGAFKSQLVATQEDITVVRRSILHGGCFALDDDVSFEVVRRIALQFGLADHTGIHIVGSAKLGFSISPQKRWKPFGDDSDIDVAIVDHNLYQRVWHEVHEYDRSGADWPKKRDFIKYLYRGWIRPDLLPQSPLFEFVGAWWEFFMLLKREEVAGPYKITGALYHDMNFLEVYQSAAIAACREVQ